MAEDRLQIGKGVNRRRPRIAICDYVVTGTSPIGSCHLALLERLCEEIDFTVFAAVFHNPRPDRIRFVKVPALRRPLALLYLSYHAAVLPVFLWSRLVRSMRFDLVQSAESYSLLGDICYSHFCHSSYLREHWTGSLSRGLRRAFRWLDHRFRSANESAIYTRARAVVVPSHGLERELQKEFATPSGKITVISNPVDLDRFARPREFDAEAFRKDLQISRHDVVATFVALGHFERKGLPFILEAMRATANPNFKLVVVGGRESVIAEYRERAVKFGLAENVIFAGMQQDVRPYLWSSDVFLFPSLYEIFSLATLQAAAAGLPILASEIYGIEEFMEDLKSGIYIDCSAEGVRLGLQKFLVLTPSERALMGKLARESVLKFGADRFSDNWARFYASQLEAMK